MSRYKIGTDETEDAFTVVVTRTEEGVPDGDSLSAALRNYKYDVDDHFRANLGDEWLRARREETRALPGQPDPDPTAET